MIASFVSLKKYRQILDIRGYIEILEKDDCLYMFRNI